MRWGGVDPEPARSLRVAWVTMRFPEPSETFAAVDLRALVALGAQVSVHGLRPARAGSERMSRERGTAGVTITAMRHGGVAGLGWAALHPLLALGLAGRVLAWGWRRPRHLLAGVVLAARAMHIMAELERAKPDIVHLFWGHYPALVGWLVRRRLPAARLSMFLGAYDAAARYPGSAAVAAEAAAVFTHARANLADLAAIGVDPARVHVIHRGLDPGLLAAPPSAVRVRGRIVVAARLIAGKGVDDAIRALAIQRASMPEAHLTVLGDGPEMPRLRALADSLGVADAVRFAGHVPHQRVFDELATAEACLLLSHKPGERLPNAVKEAMACGAVPVVADGPGMDELIRDGIDGRIVAPHDPQAAAAALAAVLGDAGVRERMGAAALDAVRQRFDAGRAMRGYVEIWRAARD